MREPPIDCAERDLARRGRDSAGGRGRRDRSVKRSRRCAAVARGACARVSRTPKRRDARPSRRPRPIYDRLMAAVMQARQQRGVMNLTP